MGDFLEEEFLLSWEEQSVLCTEKARNAQQDGSASTNTKVQVAELGRNYLVPILAAPIAESPLFPHNEVKDMKHVVYNLLAQGHNNPDVALARVIVAAPESGQGLRFGFEFISEKDPAKFLPELHAKFIRKAKEPLTSLDICPILLKDLYKFYLRSFNEILQKYFDKVGPFTYLYFGPPLFVPGDTLEAARARITQMRARNATGGKRKKKNETC